MPPIASTPPEEDYIYQIASHARSGCFAARFSGLYRSTDGGETWRPAFASLGLKQPVAALSVALPPAPENGPAVFVGLHGGMLRSYDDGQSWEKVVLPSPPPAIAALALSPNYREDGTLFAGTLEDGLLCSYDRGRRWVAWNFGLLDLRILSLAISPNYAADETLYAGTQTGLSRSANSGHAWRDMPFPIEGEPILSLALSPAFAQDATLFAGTENHGLWCSRDGGQQWQPLASSVLTGSVNAILLEPVDGRQATMLVLHENTLLISKDQGESWTRWRASKLARKEVTAICAPEGFAARARALVGFADGQVQSL